MLTDNEKLEYLHKVVIPVFKPLSASSARVGILDWNCRLAWVTEQMRRFMGIKREESLEQYTHLNVPMQFINKFCQYNKISPEHFYETTQKIYIIINKVFKTKQTVNFVVLMPLHRSFHGYARTAVPILHPNGEVVGIQIIGFHHTFFGVQEFIHLLHKQEYTPMQFYPGNNADPEYNKRKLSPRQQEILFLVSQGISQDLAAQILGIKRGTLSKIITDQICPKFDIFPPHYLKLLEIVRNEGLNKYIPESFWRTFVLEL